MKRLNTNPEIESKVFGVNKYFPNSELPLLIYHGALELPAQKNKAAEIMQRTFLRNNWGNTWKNGIYNFHHFHSNTHECLGITNGEARVIFGGPGMRALHLQRGDVCVLPAGLAHKCVECSDDFECVGSYPQGKNYDILHGEKDEYERAVSRIAKVSIPRLDPIFGKEGFLKTYWTVVS